MACTSVQFVAPYDEGIYTGITEYKELLNKHIKDASVMNGLQSGSFEENQIRYNELEVKIDLLIDRARLQSTGSGCSLVPALADRMSLHLRDDMPADLLGAEITEDDNSYGCTEMLLRNVRSQLDQLKTIHREIDRCERRSPNIDSVVFPEDSSAANLSNVIDEAVDEVLGTLKSSIKLAVIEHIETNFNLSGDSSVIEGASAEDISCLRIPTAQLALDISNQSINAVWVLENAKKTPEE